MYNLKFIPYKKRFKFTWALKNIYAQNYATRFPGLSLERAYHQVLVATSTGTSTRNCSMRKGKDRASTNRT